MTPGRIGLKFLVIGRYTSCTICVLIWFYRIQMQSTVVKHKKDGGVSGGVFESYNILRVSIFSLC